MAAAAAATAAAAEGRLEREHLARKLVGADSLLWPCCSRAGAQYLRDRLPSVTASPAAPSGIAAAPLGRDGGGRGVIPAVIVLVVALVVAVARCGSAATATIAAPRNEPHRVVRRWEASRSAAHARRSARPADVRAREFVKIVAVQGRYPSEAISLRDTSREIAHTLVGARARDGPSPSPLPLPRPAPSPLPRPAPLRRPALRKGRGRRLRRHHRRCPPFAWPRARIRWRSSRSRYHHSVSGGGYRELFGEVIEQYLLRWCVRAVARGPRPPEPREN